MTGKERVMAMISGQECDCLPLMPITMQFAADRIGRTYRDYATDHRVLAEAQMRVADEFLFDYVSAISDPAREAADCGATVFYPPDAPPAIDESQSACGEDRSLINDEAWESSFPGSAWERHVGEAPPRSD